jgi:hypothetical protein
MYNPRLRFRNPQLRPGVLPCDGPPFVFDENIRVDDTATTRRYIAMGKASFSYVLYIHATPDQVWAWRAPSKARGKGKR